MVRHIVIIAPQGTSILDVAGPVEVFQKAADYITNYVRKSAKTYQVHVLSTNTKNLIQTSSGLPFLCEGDIDSADYKIDTILLAGIPNAPVNMVNAWKKCLQ